MAGNIKGITIEFRGDTTSLDKALRSIKDKTKGVDTALRNVNKALKFNPGNVELLGQKQTLLKKKIEQTKDTLEAFKKAQAKMDGSGVDKQSAEYMEVRRNIIECESKLKNYNSTLKQTETEMNKVYRAGQKFEEIGGKIQSAGNALRYVSMAAAGVAASIGGITVNAARTADDLNTLSKVSGISTQQLQLYAASADLVDVSVETMAKSQQRMKKNMLTAASGTGDAAKSFDALGISVTDANGNLRDQEQVFQETIRALGAMENETERDAMAMTIFGKSAGELNPLIEDMGQTYSRVMEAMNANGLEFVDQETLDKANEFNDQLDTIKLTALVAIQNVGSKIAAYLVPTITKIQEAFSTVMGYINNMSGEALSKIMAIAGAVATLAPVLVIVGGAFNLMGGAMQNVAKYIPGLSTGLSAIFGFMKANPIILVIGALVALSAIFAKTGMTADQLSTKIQEVVTSIAKKLPDIIEGVVNALVALIPAIAAMTPVILEGFIALLTGMVDAIPQIIPPLIAGLTTLITQFVNAMPVLLPKIIDGAFALFMGIVAAIPQVVAALVEAMPQIIAAIKNSLGVAIPAIFSAIWSAIKSIFTSAASWFGSIFSRVWAAIKQPFIAVGSFFGGIWDTIKSKFTDIGQKVGDAVGGAFKGAVNAVLSTIESVLNVPINAINTLIDVINKVPGVNLGKLNTFSLPRLAKGGVLTSARTVIAGEAGAEAIVPLERNKEWIERVAKDMVAQLSISWQKKGGLFDKPAPALQSSPAMFQMETLQTMLNAVADSIVNGMGIRLATQGAGVPGQIVIQAPMYPNQAAAGEAIVNLQRLYDKRL